MADYVFQKMAAIIFIPSLTLILQYDFDIPPSGGSADALSHRI